MSAAATQAPVRVFTNTRRVPRFPLAVPADVTVLRSGIPYSIPGRSVTIGERGLGVVVAGELHPGDSVGIEFRLPGAGGPFRLKAIVRYQALLHCGLEFVSLTSEQQTLIEHWTRKKSGGNSPTPLPVANAKLAAAPASTVNAQGKIGKTTGVQFRRVLWLSFAGMLLLAGLAWWHWHQAWGELESQIPAGKAQSQQPPTYVPAEMMEKLLTHKIEPIYPEAARQANVQGIVVIDAVIGTDGTVVDVRAVSGPEEITSAALDAVKWWRFQPYLVNGQPVEVTTRLAVDFRAN
jgi:TonB family protein